MIGPDASMRPAGPVCAQAIQRIPTNDPDSPGMSHWIGGCLTRPGPTRWPTRTAADVATDLAQAFDLAEIVADLAALRWEADRGPGKPHDVVAALPPGDDPAP